MSTQSLYDDEHDSPAYAMDHLQLTPMTSMGNNRYDKTADVLLSHMVIEPGLFHFTAGPEQMYLPPGWAAYTHPDRQLYFFRNIVLRVVTEAYLYRPEMMDKISSWTSTVEKALQIRGINPSSTMELFLEPREDLESCGYYLVDHSTHSVFWIHQVSTELLGLERVVSLSHLKSALEELYWTHLEFFPMHLDGLPSETVDELISVFAHGQVDRMTSSTSTFPYPVDECAQFIRILKNTREQEMDGHLTWITARLWCQLARHRLLIYSSDFGEGGDRQEAGSGASQRLQSDEEMDIPDSLRWDDGSARDGMGPFLASRASSRIGIPTDSADPAPPLPPSIIPLYREPSLQRRSPTPLTQLRISLPSISEVLASIPLLPFLFMPLVYQKFSAQLIRAAQHSELLRYLGLYDNAAIGAAPMSTAGPDLLQNFEGQWQEYRAWLVDTWRVMITLSSGIIGAVVTIAVVSYANDNLFTLTVALLTFCWLLTNLSCTAILVLYFGSKQTLHDGFCLVVDIVRPAKYTSKAFFILSVPLVFLCFGIISFIAAILSLIWRSPSPATTVGQHSQSLISVITIIGAIFTSISVIVWISMALFGYSRASRRHTQGYNHEVAQIVDSTSDDGHISVPCHQN